jgi:hypothetical protein
MKVLPRKRKDKLLDLVPNDVWSKVVGKYVEILEKASPTVEELAKSLGIGRHLRVPVRCGGTPCCMPYSDRDLLCICGLSTKTPSLPAQIPIC